METVPIFRGSLFQAWVVYFLKHSMGGTPSRVMGNGTPNVIKKSVVSSVTSPVGKDAQFGTDLGLGPF